MIQLTFQGSEFIIKADFTLNKNDSIDQFKNKLFLDKNIMKKLMPLHEKNAKVNRTNIQATKSFLKPSKSQIFLIKRNKKSTSPQKGKIELSKNDQRVTIYTDKIGFIVDYSILSFGLKCDCYVHETITKKLSKTFKLENIQLRQNLARKKIKLEITLNKHHLAVIKAGVEHIFSLPSESKHSFLKVVLTQNWQIQQFTVPNKKTKIFDGQLLSASQNNLDQIYPLNNIVEADELRKNKLVKSDSKIKISWSGSQKESVQDSSWDKSSEILSFSSERLPLDMSQSLIVESTKQIPRTAFLRKSFNECDQTRDSEEEHIVDEKIFQKKQVKTQNKANKTLSIDLTQWNEHPVEKQDLFPSFKQDDFHDRIRERKHRIPATQRFFK